MLQLIDTFLKELGKKGLTTLLNCKFIISYVMFSTNFWTRKLHCFAMSSFTPRKSLLKIYTQKMALYINSFLKTHPNMRFRYSESISCFPHIYNTVHWTVWTDYPTILLKQKYQHLSSGTFLGCFGIHIMLWVTSAVASI